MITCLSGVASGQAGLNIGFSAGYAISANDFQFPGNGEILQPLMAHNSFGGLALTFPLSEEAGITTGFRLRQKSLTASALLDGEVLQESGSYTAVELPLGFCLTKPLGQRMAIRQTYALEMQVLGGSDGYGQTQPGGPAFQVFANPAHRTRLAMSAGATLEYRMLSGLCIDLELGFHQGLTGSMQEGQLVLRSPDEIISRTFFGDGSYFSGGLGISFPANLLTGRRLQPGTAIN